MAEEDRAYCSSSYLMYRYVFDRERAFSEEKSCNICDISFSRLPVKNSDELIAALRQKMADACADGRAVLALSGGIDSALLARFAPQGTKAMTFRCVIPGKKLIDESTQASHWAKLNGLKHEVLDLTWENVEKASAALMKPQGSSYPFHRGPDILRRSKSGRGRV